MIVVSNSTPLITLSKIGKINILESIFSRISIPQAVYNEIAVQGKGKPGWDFFSSCSFIEVKPVTNVMAVQFLQTQLDLGESEAIVLAKELNADLLILDEKKARNIAKLQGLQVIGTIGVLQKAKDTGIIISIKACMDMMLQSGIWLDESLYNYILQQNNE